MPNDTKVLHNDFFYTQLAFILLPQKDFYYMHNDTDAFLFLLKSWYLPQAFFVFWFFLFQKDFDIFPVLLLGAFIYVLDNFYGPFLYIEKNVIKSVLLVFFICLKNKIYRMSYVSYMSYVNYMSYVRYVSYFSYVHYVSFVSYLFM